MRDFTAATLNTRWCRDITYIGVGATWLYLAPVIDICSRKLVGWSITDHMRTPWSLTRSNFRGLERELLHGRRRTWKTQTRFSESPSAQ
ncbi:DDE-type integrase/transposase/recombinase [Streptomyces sp. NPDC051639]|uniref:DDE-type integrase/transposase/recombinase n=1 Tax=Streptomyces sp. NPDC051639 TaxID=3155671 RepID=UPI00342697EE